MGFKNCFLKAFLAGLLAASVVESELQEPNGRTPPDFDSVLSHS